MYNLNIQNFAKKPYDRKETEDKEGYKTVKTGEDGKRFSSEKQVLSPDQMGVTESSIPGTEEKVTTSNMPEKAAKSLRSSIKVKPDVSVDELKNTQVGGVPLSSNTGVLRSVAGLSNLSPADDQSKIPYSEGGYRPTTRYGKKKSEDLFEMDNTITEQVVPYVEDSLDLREAPEAKQGYNGRKQFKQTRSKKNMAYSVTQNNTTYDQRLPQQLLNDCSVDFEGRSKLIYACGQMLEGINRQSDYPAVEVTDPSGKNHTDAIIMHKGNYKLKNFKFVLENGKIKSFGFDEDRIVVKTNPLARDQANMNWQVDANNVAKTMVKIQKDLGRETSELWSPLGYVVTQGYQYNMLMHDIEAMTAAMEALFYRSSVSSMAFQRNILAKDGVNPSTNAIKMILGGYAGTLKNSSRQVLKNITFNKSIFNKTEYAKGSPAAIIEMFDSTGKYSTKADILGLQRSFTLHLSQCDNNLNPLHCKPNFIKSLDKAHLFSTVDGTYNPWLPIELTKKLALVNPMSLNIFCQNWKHPDTLTMEDRQDPRRDQESGTYSFYSYKYKDLRENTYWTKVQHPIVEGIIRWMLQHENALAKAYGSNATVVMPAEANMLYPTMFGMMMCSASQYVLWKRNIIYRDVLFANDQLNDYMWPDLEGLDKLNPLSSSQLTIGKYDEPLKMGKMAADSCVREFWGNQMSLTDRQSGPTINTKAQYILPWTFNERAFTGDYTQNEGFFHEELAFNMTIPSIRDGVRHEYVDIIKSMDERDIRLSLDRWVDIPLFNEKEDTNVTILGTEYTHVWTTHTPVTTSNIINNYIKLSAVRYEANSDGRVAVTYQLEDTNVVGHLDEYSLYCVPRELGWIGEYYDSENIITNIEETNNGITVTTKTMSPYTTFDGARVYNGYNSNFLVSYRVEADAYTAASIDRSAALSQCFYVFFASSDANDENEEYIKKIGIVPCLSAQKYAELKTMPYYALNSKNATDTVLDNNVITRAPVVWSFLQRYFCPVNKFENCFTVDVSKTAFDPLETSFYFGVCGTLASDYTQDILERLDVVDQLGLDYTEDVFIHDTPIFK